MLNYQRPTAIESSSRESLLVQEHNHDQDHQEEEQIRDIYALTPPRPPSTNRGRRRETWETNSHRSSANLSTASTEIASSENFSTMSREFNALVLAGSSISNNHGSENDSNNNNNNNNSNILGRIGEDDYERIEETNPLAIVPDNYSNPLSLDNTVNNNPSSRDHVVTGISGINSMSGINHGEVSTVQRVKKEEVESKISAWQNAKISKINNRFKREDAVIIGWESEEVQKATSWMKKVERKLEEKRAKALEKMQNDIAKARRKAEERRASAEAKRGTKVAKVLEICNLMRAVGRAPAKRSFF